MQVPKEDAAVLVIVTGLVVCTNLAIAVGVGGFSLWQSVVLQSAAKCRRSGKVSAS